MWANCSQTPSLNIARHGSTSVTSPSTIRNPVGLFIQALTAITQKVPDDAGARHRDQHGQVPPRRHPAPPVEVDAEEDRLDEERQPLERERQPEHVAERAHQPGPQQPHLEAEHGPRDGADREQHRRHLRPPLGQPERDRVVADDPAAVHHVDHRRERDPEAGQDDVPAQGDRHLVAGREQPGAEPRSRGSGSGLSKTPPRRGYVGTPGRMNHRASSVPSSSRSSRSERGTSTGGPSVIRGCWPATRPRHERRGQLVGDALVDEVAQQVRARPRTAGWSSRAPPGAPSARGG